MQPVIKLDYHARSENRWRWANRLGIASIAIGTLTLFASIIRASDAWQDVFDPNIRWAYPPPGWVCPAYLAGVLAETAVTLLLVIAGICSLIQPVKTYRVHLMYAVGMIPLAILTAFIHWFEFLRHPAFLKPDMLWGVPVECIFFGGYPAYILILVKQKLHPTGHDRLAV